MRKELEGISPEELEQAAQEAREDRARYWDKRLRDENDDFNDFDLSKPGKVPTARKVAARASVGLRLGPGELALIDQAARARGVSFSEFVREAALIVASGKVSLDDEEQARRISDLRIRMQEFEEAITRALAQESATG